MEEKKASIINYAMHYGAILGLFWAFKYLVYVGASYWEHFIYLYYLLNAGTFFLIYIFYFRYKESDTEKMKSALQCAVFTILACFFASFFEGAMIYLHYKFIDPGYFAQMIHPFTESIEQVKKMDMMSDEEFAESKKILYSIFNNRGTYILGKFIGNTFIGLIFGVLIGALGNKKYN
ncbi:DUF4199 domain-containing protein [Dysgonomonas sp. ZJ279]|uniref:DUF4199 domain-containing protein n=1 Tax=Dysgonomonas sp. ZJ279 TaxID=2709796 RepID=UPI0013EACD54|nr:DUF4199 domain-containing protein [Dysgonomonas sp. ZJ279]